MMFGRIDNIARAMDFLSLFYDMTPNGKCHTLREISKTLGTSPGNARQWIDAASCKIPVTEIGVEVDYNHKGPGAYLYGLMK